MNRSNISYPLLRLLCFLVDRLPAHLERVGDGLPRPALLTCIGDLNRLEPFEQSPQSQYRAQSDLRVGLPAAAARVVADQDRPKASFMQLK